MMGPMRQAYAHEGLVRILSETDPAAVGAAVTVALCGQLSHDPPCPLAAHHTEAVPSGEQLSVRVVFAAEPADEAEVRRRIDDALAWGEAGDPEENFAHWELDRSAPAVLLEAERDLAERLRKS